MNLTPVIHVSLFQYFLELWLTLKCITFKNGQAHFKNLAVKVTLDPR